MQNGKTIKTRKNVDFNVDIFNVEKSLKKVLTKQMLCYKINFVVSEIITHNNVWA